MFVRFFERSPKLATLLLIAVSVGVGRPAIAQTALPNVPIRNNDGSVTVDGNARDFTTGPLTNTSNIPLPSALPTDTQEGRAIPVGDGLAPNTIQIRPDLPYIQENFNTIINGPTPNPNRLQYTLQPDTVKLKTTFDLVYLPGDHSFGEGIEVRILDGAGKPKSSQTIFVRGDRVTKGPDGTDLPIAGQIEAVYGVGEVVELRVLNLRADGQPASDSAIYFTRDFKTGGFIVEDSQDGGDLDFDDGEYVQAPLGSGTANARQERGNLTVTTREERVDLDPLIEQVVVEEQDVLESDVRSEVKEVELAREYGEVEITSFEPSILLGHATGVRAESGEQLLYNRYSNTQEARLGSDGVSITGQLSPLIGNPSAPPTLVTGNLRFNPFVDDNEAGLVARLGLTQFLTRTHRLARDEFGNDIVGPDDSRLLEPTGLLSNRRLVGYVPTVTGDPVQGEPITSSGGIFKLPGNTAITIAPPDSQQVGRGKAAYTDNVGGLMIERADGALTFVPQWTKAGYEQSPISLAAGEATRIIYALVPQQAGQNLQLGQTYAVTKGGSEYQIADGGFKIISADRQPQNFIEETAEVYAVEDTVAAAPNAANNLFNGIPGVYVEAPGGAPVATVDVASMAEADARVGNNLYVLNAFQEAGQPAYVQTTRAGGLYVSGGLTGGFGNQRDTVFLSRQTTEFALDQVLNRRTTTTFSTPRSRTDTINTETGTVTQLNGTVAFGINRAGELENPVFTPTEDEEETTTVVDGRETRTPGAEQLGEREELGSDATDTVISETATEIGRDEEPITREDSYPNFSAVSGEAALGGVYNFGNTPWTTAANTARAELFYRDTVFGRSRNGSETGVRAEIVFHPFGEVKRDAYRYDAAGNVVPVYQTEPTMNANGSRMVETVQGENGESVDLAVNQFVLDETGDRLLQQVGTGKSKGPGAYLRAENVFNSSDGVEVQGGLQISF